MGGGDDDADNDETEYDEDREDHNHDIDELSHCFPLPPNLYLHPWWYSKGRF